MQTRTATAAADDHVVPANRASRASGVIASAGRPLDPAPRREMEARFGHHFGDVRVHDDASAAASAAALGAFAYTFGSHLVFGPRRYAPSTAEGKSLLAHELTHVVQQRVSSLPATIRRQGADSDPAMRDWRPGRPLPYRQAKQYSECLETLGRTHISDCEALIGLPERFRVRTPAAALVTDPRAAVLSTEAKMFADLVRILGDFNTRVRGLVKTGVKDEPWIEEKNANIQALFTLIDELQKDMAAGAFILRFDQPPASNAAASYTSSDDTMHLQAFSTDEEAVPIVADLVHEYAHVRQDRRMEELVAGSTKPVVHTADEELEKEIEARRVQTYFERLLIALGVKGLSFHEELNARVFVSTRFEVERTGTPAKKRAATKGIRKELGSAYAAQIAAHTPSLYYRIDITAANEAVLHVSPKKTINLGAVPPGVQTRTDLESAIHDRLAKHAEFGSLFPKQGGVTPKHATFLIFYGGRKLGEITVPPP